MSDEYPEILVSELIHRVVKSMEVIEWIIQLLFHRQQQIHSLKLFKLSNETSAQTEFSRTIDSSLQFWV